MKNPQVDEYIKKAPEFAKPILVHVRALIHKASPDIEETIKWGVPHFEYKGVICSIAAFKEHCAFGYWKEPLIPEMHEHIKNKASAWGSIGRVTSVKDLPSDELIIRWTKAAIELNEKGIKLDRGPKGPATEKNIPADLSKALKANEKAEGYWKEFSTSKKNEYIDWLEEAKTEETRNKRLETAIEWISEGKERMWKYHK